MDILTNSGLGVVSLAFSGVLIILRNQDYLNKFSFILGEDDELGLRVTNQGGFVRTDQKTAHFHHLLHEHERTSKRILTQNQHREHFRCSAERFLSDGLTTLDYLILEEDDLGLIRNISVDVKFTNTRQPRKLCEYDSFFEKLGKLFDQKVLNGNEKDTLNWLDELNLNIIKILNSNLSAET